MKKLRLELDELVVESFTPEQASLARGTVHGHVSLYWEDCSPSETCPGAGWPCDHTQQSCGGTCYEASCAPGGCGGGGGQTAGWVAGMTCNGVICVDMPPEG